VIVNTAAHRYAVRRDDMIDLRLAHTSGELRIEGQADRQYIGVELGPLLDPADQSTLTRHRALIVPLRRRYIALLVDHIETFLEHADTRPLPPLVSERLGQPWAIGALIYQDELVVQLDLRAVARSALLAHSGRST
jgi:hypothetical protein